jgi:hypothetical protein
MPRIGQLLSALLLALIGVLVVQMFLLAGMQQRLLGPQTPVPSLDQMTSAAALDPAPLEQELSCAAAPQRPIIIVTMHPTAVPPQVAPVHIPIATMLDLDTLEATPALSSVGGDDGRALIERFIDMTDTRLGSDTAGKEGET